MLDKFNLRRVILEEYLQIKEGLNLGKKANITNERFDSVTITGMGGSALPGDVLRVFFNKLARRPIPIFLNRSYSLLPEDLGKSLNIFCSYSGNTEETISSFRQALQQETPCLVITGGGELEKMAEENKIPLLKIPRPYENFQPRMATGYFVFALWQVLSDLGLTDDFEKEILRSAENLRIIIAESEEKGKAIAEKTADKIPVIYATDTYRAVAMIWKIKFNENAKIPAFWNFFPEMNHNEMVGYTQMAEKFFFIMLRDKEADRRLLKRSEITTEMLRAKGATVEIIDMPGENIWEKTMGTIYLGDWVSYYSALRSGIDPTPVEMVENFKAKMKE